MPFRTGAYYSLLVVLLLVPSACTERSEAAAQPNRLRSTKTSKIKTFEVFGVHLGMPISDARKVLVAQGFSRSDHNKPRDGHAPLPVGPGFFWEGYYWRKNTNDNMELAYTRNRSGVAAVSLIYAPESFGDITRAQALIRVIERYGPPTQTVDHVRYKDYWWTGVSTSIDSQKFYDSMTCFDHQRCSNAAAPPDMCRADRILNYPAMNIEFNTNKPRDLVAYITIVDFGTPYDLLFARTGKRVIHRPESCPPVVF